MHFEFMAGLLRSSIRLIFVLFISFFLVACGTNSAGGFNSFQSPDGRYAFLYPTGWTRVAVNNGPQVVFHDLINSDETLSLVVSDVGGEVNLELLGSADEVGKRLISQVIAPEGAVRQVELVKAAEREYSSHTFYDLEYIVHLPERDRHELSTVVVDRGSLYTFATSTNQVRWDKMKNIFERVIQSFEFLV